MYKETDAQIEKYFSEHILSPEDVIASATSEVPQTDIENYRRTVECLGMAIIADQPYRESESEDVHKFVYHGLLFGMALHSANFMSETNYSADQKLVDSSFTMFTKFLDEAVEENAAIGVFGDIKELFEEHVVKEDRSVIDDFMFDYVDDPEYQSDFRTGAYFAVLIVDHARKMIPKKHRKIRMSQSEIDDKFYEMLQQNNVTFPEFEEE